MASASAGDNSSSFSTFYGSNPAFQISEDKSDHMDIHKQRQHASQLLAAILEMKDELHLIDTQLLVRNCVYPCHQAILAAGSPYFSEIISGKNNQTSKGLIEMHENKLEPKQVQHIINYVYTGSVTMSHENAANLLHACNNHKIFKGKVVESALRDYISRQTLNEVSNSGTSSTECFKEFNYALDILKALNLQRLDCEFTDIVIQVGDESFSCHKIVLAASSAYFKAMFSSQMREMREGIIILHGLHPAVMRTLINYTYTGKLTIGTADAQEMMATASFLHHTSAMLACSEFMTSELHPSNCLGMLQFAQDVGCQELYKHALWFSLAHFLNELEYDEFNNMSADLLSRLIEDDELNVNKEEQVYEAVMQWIHHQKEQRQYHLPKLIEKVRLPLIDAAYTSRFIESDSLIKRWSSVVMVLDEAKKMKLAACRGEKIDDIRMKLRFSMKKEVMVIVGGFTDNQQCVRDVRCYNPENGAWIDLAPFPGRNQRFQCVAVNNNIYVIGGQAENQKAHLSETLSDVWKYDSHQDKWTQVASLNKPRHGHGAAVLDGKIYVVGGKIGWSKKFNEVERYDPHLNIWTTVGRIKGNFVEKPIVLR
ncbi:kelch-like protein 6 [Ptychodera flava]|uniref:kelch-like protein 6 n=1 Tax=Ptychodera flava TaxID=63121 RepID=UPI00396A9F93